MAAIVHLCILVPFFKMRGRRRGWQVGGLSPSPHHPTFPSQGPLGFPRQLRYPINCFDFSTASASSARAFQSGGCAPGTSRGGRPPP